MAANGFKSPAPVLPAMGLHSFHNDSPPFAGMASADYAEPEALSLDGQVSRSATASNGHGPSVTSPHMSIPIPLPSGVQRGFSLDENELDDISPRAGRGIASNNDEHLSSSRSRRLVSGYMFGNPPSPFASRNQSPNGNGDGNGNGAGNTTSATGKRIPTPTEHVRALDSPPLPETSVDSTLQALARVSLENQSSTSRSASATASGSSERRSSSKIRDKETGYDALNGLNDGEADLDESAPQAEGEGSEAYLRGESGPAGEYAFPRHRLRTRMKDESKIPLVIVACGSFSPPTYLHLRMFEMAKDEILESQTYEIMAGYYSPVSSHYKKAGLAPARHRVRMCELAVEHTSTWLMVDPWEAGQPEYQRTAVVLDHFDEMLNGPGGKTGVEMSDGRRRKFKVMLLAGGDLIESFGEPGVWSEPDLHIILGRFGCLIVERAGSDVWAFLLSHDILYHHRRNVIVIKQLIYNDISSTKVRLFVRRDMSIKYLLPNSVIQYIYDNKLYR